MKYEITIITKENPPAGGAPVKKGIEGLGGKIIAVNSLGQRQFIYPIKKETAGYYTVVNFEIEPTKVLELNKKLSLSGEILRHLILVAKAVKAEAPKPASPKIPEAKIEKPEKPAKKVVEKEVKPTVTKEVAKIEEEESSTEERLKALDKKLDELLKE